ncbi:MAG: oligoendopeptidase, pepF/M3 family [Thermoleophilia bacterium]|nr:oligoendopeptidase, pepF/M3 family [Thermoleophilia bacterium]
MLDASVPLSRREAHARRPSWVWLKPDPGCRRKRPRRARSRIRTREFVASTILGSFQPMATIELTGAEEVAWDLSDLYESGDDPRLEQDVQEAEAAAAAFRERYYGRVAELSATEFAEAIDERERIESIFTRAIYYAHLWFSTDMADSPRGALLARLTEKGAGLDTQLLFFGLEIADLDDAATEVLLADAALERWAHWLRSVRKFRPYILTEPEEKIMTEKSVSGMTAWDRLFDELLGAVRVDLDGAEISFEEAMAKLYSGDREERRQASEAVTVALEPGLRTRTFIFNTIVLDKSIDDRLRGYETWLSARNLRNDTTDEAVQALIDATTARYDVVQRYYRLKARLIGLDRLTFYDRMAPIGDDPTKASWDDARQIVVDAYRDFSGEVGDIAERFFRESWIDAPVRDNKRSGAFCATNVPGVHPYVFMNFTGDRRSILTLAHELGHGLHGYLAQPLGLFNADTPLTTAETASVFGEALTFKRLLAVEDDPSRRLNLLAGRIEDSIATVFRQIALNRFEDAVHTTRREEGEFSMEKLEALWLESQTQLFGDSVDIDGYGTWWSYVSHFMGSPGYVYAYAYGFLFALSIFRKYELEGETMVEPYLDVLRAGGSRPPEELAKIVGLDLTDPRIWESGIDALAAELDEAEALAAEIGLG